MSSLQSQLFVVYNSAEFGDSWSLRSRQMELEEVQRQQEISAVTNSNIIHILEFQALSGQNSRPVALKVSFAHHDISTMCPGFHKCPWDMVHSSKHTWDIAPSVHGT